MLSTIERNLMKLIIFLRETNKLNLCFKGFDENQIVDIYMTECCGKKINLEQKMEMTINKGTKPTYKTEKGYASSKLDNLFKDFYNFLVFTTDEIKQIVLNNKVEIIDEKFNLDYDNPNKDNNTMEIYLYKLTEMLIEANKTTPNETITLLHTDLKKILP